MKPWRMQFIQGTLLKYRRAFGRIPCPGDMTLGINTASFGVEGANKGPCTGNGQFDSADQMTIDKDGNLWIGDFNNCRAQKFDSSGSFILKFGSCGSGNGQFNGPEGIAIGAQ